MWSILLPLEIKSWRWRAALVHQKPGMEQASAREQTTEKCLSVKHCRLRSCRNLLVLIHLSPRAADGAKLHNVCEAWNSSVTAQTRAGTATSSVLLQTRALERSTEEAAPSLKAALERAFLMCKGNQERAACIQNRQDSTSNTNTRLGKASRRVHYLCCWPIQTCK